MSEWTEEVFRLPENHGWKCKPGYKSFVADQGAVRFDFPADWVFVPGSNSLKFYDRQPPDDTCLLELSVFRLAANVDWRELSLKQLLADVVRGDREGVLSQGEVIYQKRGDLEIAWMETRYIDPDEHREACSRCCLARRAQIQPLFTFAFWPEDLERVAPAWNELLRSLRLGEYVTPPIRRGRN